MSQSNGKNLILDLDETMVHTFSPEDKAGRFMDEMDSSRQYTIEFERGGALYGYVRPHAEEFLIGVFELFDTVSVWSAGTHEYVHKIVEVLFERVNKILAGQGKSHVKPYFIMTRRHCNELKLSSDRKVCRFKPLSIVFKQYKTFNSKNTILVDDRQDICELNCLNNIQLPEYILTYETYESLKNDRALLDLLRWFRGESFSSTDDIVTAKRTSPFSIEVN